MNGGLDIDRLLHELRNPFAAIFTTSSMIGEMPDGTPLSDVRRHLELIQSAVERGRALLDAASGQLDEGRRRERAESADREVE